ncbi:MAG: rhodanese-related sulfurtransferase [Bacteroidia bacterium]|nr:rhodanese-related sulfurtransferase [Bacteroidia bacterium]
MVLHNKYNKEELKEKLYQEGISRKTVSYYRYIIIENPQEYRDELYIKFDKLNIFGRIHLAKEGINAQISVPEANWNKFTELINQDKYTTGVPLKIAIEDDGKSFYKLAIRVRDKIVADGLDAGTFDVTNVGNHLNAEQFNNALEDPNAIVVDIRNHYESEVGHFEGAICPDADTFKDELPIILETLSDKKDKKILMYCTGGIRCEKASAYLKHHGFKDVNQLYGGIINYTQEVKEKGLEQKFIGKNFVFDERLGERITEDIISECHQCGKQCDDHTNCKNDDCHLLFIQCEECAEKHDGCCTLKCQEIASLPIEEQRKLRKGENKTDAHSVYKSRLRPNLKEILAAKK